LQHSKLGCGRAGFLREHGRLTAVRSEGNRRWEMDDGTRQVPGLGTWPLAGGAAGAIVGAVFGSVWVVWSWVNGGTPSLDLTQVYASIVLSLLALLCTACAGVLPGLVWGLLVGVTVARVRSPGWRLALSALVGGGGGLALGVVLAALPLTVLWLPLYSLAAGVLAGPLTVGIVEAFSRRSAVPAFAPDEPPQEEIERGSG
jgi:hypothetical protein